MPDGLVRRPVDFDRRPMLVFWEVTRACLLACRHCRASAIAEPLPGELSHEQGLGLIETLTEFGRPYPVLVMTGGDALMRLDLVELAGYARALGVPVAIAPSVTPRLEPAVLEALRRVGVKVVSVSLDGAAAETHEGLRGVVGHFQATLEAVRLLRRLGFTVQVNTVVRPENLMELPEIAALVRSEGAAVWEVFFLISVGRGRGLWEVGPAEAEAVCHFLYDASCYGFIVRTVEAPFFRRVAAWRTHGAVQPPSELHAALSASLRRLLGRPTSVPRAQTKGTRDGKGIVFVAHNGDIYPSGFLPIALGNVTRDRLADVYRDGLLLQQIRAGRFHGRCRACDYTDRCGGSRARAYAHGGDPLGEDPACDYNPVSMTTARAG